MTSLKCAHWGQEVGLGSNPGKGVLASWLGCTRAGGSCHGCDSELGGSQHVGLSPGPSSIPGYEYGWMQAPGCVPAPARAHTQGFSG